MTDRYHIAIVGAGPAGLSAAARAAALDQQAGRQQPSYILLEGFSAHARTMQQYQKGKHVMAEPGFLDLRCDLPFAASTRENVLEGWQQGILSAGLNLSLNTEVRAVDRDADALRLELSDGGAILAENVVLAIGMAGNPRRLGCPGENLPEVSYTLEDPAAYEDETILVIGAGDAAIENALALATQNQVLIVNRREEFSRAKEANLTAALRAISDPGIGLDCAYNATVKGIEPAAKGALPLTVTLLTPEGEREIPCHRVIARLGGVPPRAFVESTGVEFPSAEPGAIPELSGRYESNVPGLYIIGSLGGFPLIKQALNQGYDVVEYIHGHELKPADFPLLDYQFRLLPYELEPDRVLQALQQRIPLFSQLTSLQFRELVIESNMLVSYPAGPLYDEAAGKSQALAAELAERPHRPRMPRLIAQGDALFTRGEFGTSCFVMVDGEVKLDGTSVSETLERGDLFGESSLISGRARDTTAIAGPSCIVIEVPRRTMLKLMSSNESIRSGVDALFIARELRRHFAPTAALRDLLPLAERAPLQRHRPGTQIYTQGERAESLFLLRSGAVLLRREQDGTTIALGEFRSGAKLGELGLMGDSERRETAVAAVSAETIEVDRALFLELLGDDQAHIEALQQAASEKVKAHSRTQSRPEATPAMEFLMDQGLGEATDVLVINEALCIGCDNCEDACAETHDGTSRLDRNAGKAFAGIHIPIACRHCEQPHCMKDCPPNAIHRATSGEVFIDTETCIGCGNCETNCPYDVIRMVEPAPKKPGLLRWMLFGNGSGPGEDRSQATESAAPKKAMKCDACIGQAGGPACVRACPTGAALRIAPEDYLNLVES